MNRKISLACAVASALVLSVPAAWGTDQPYRDAGDATTAKQAALQLSPAIRDAGDAAEARLGLRSPTVAIRDAGDAMSARLDVQQPALVTRDAGDATAARLAFAAPSLVDRDAGDATAARLSPKPNPTFAVGSDRGTEPVRLGLGLVLVMAVVLTVMTALRVARSNRVAH